MIELHLPYPPSMNTYWRHVGARVLISAKGRAYRTAVHAEVLDQLRRGPLRLPARLSVAILAYPPDRRARDLDNLPKAVLDALTHAGLWLDDAQIDRLLIQRMETLKDGAITVQVESLPAAP